MSEERTERLPVLPLNHGVVLPHMNATIPVESQEAKAALQAARGDDLRVLLVPKLEGRYASVGTVAKIEDTGQMPDGTPAAVVEGRYRARFTDVSADPVSGGLVAAVEPILDPTSIDDETRDLMSEYRAVTENILELRGVPQIAQVLRAIENPGHLADMSGYSPDFSRERKVELLETVDVKERLRKVVEWQRGVLGELTLKDQLRQEVSERMEKQQKDFLLRQQMEAIKKQLGETGDVGTEYRRRLEESGMPEGPRKEAERELDRLERTSEQNPEYGWIRNYLDWMLDLPWSSRSEDNFDLVEARRILDEDHYGLEDVKDRIIEFLAVRKRRADRGSAPVGGRGSGAIITLVGPPGVGKTSLGESIARSLGRKFARVSLGGIHDEAEIRGHRRTYVGALPGRIVRAIKEAGTMNPVIMLDEIDKVGADWRGDPSSALLEVLDPAQNHSFRDHYLEVDLDLSDVLFIPTGNVADTIPGPLLDRMELVRLDGYTEEEKLHIASRHLLPRQLLRNGVDANEVSVTDAAIAKVISEFTREAGVRQLERELGRLLRKTVTEVDSGKLTPPVEIGEDRVREFLGKARFQFEVAERTSVPGVATGLAVTGTGGDVLFIEASEMPGEHGGLTLTGQLGDVMKESVQIALSYVRSHARELGIGSDFEKKHVHVHVPAGAVPKDGPSAGVTMTTALVSLFTGRPVRSTVGMTGEVTLQGRVLPIGGVKQKVLAAKRAGLKEVILPARNEPDLDDLPKTVRDEMTIHLASEVSEVLALALEPASPSVAVAV
jgi:ATP-dependent Lon protease